ncbi:MAG: hybrid sensor histidine kinase/response regulator [Chloroflexi bacterium]|nr:MAG: hybrid sensor histidine kinase/response regulator [Chloroflexota bacterium]
MSVAREQERATQRSDHAPPPAVLLVEDDVVLSELVTTLVKGAGYQAVTIADHNQIGEAIDRFDPKCVILDGEIGRTGLSRSWDDAAAIRRAHPALPVLMFTADAEAIAEERAGTSPRSRNAGFVGAVPKPFVVEEFLATLQSAVRGVPSARPDAVAIFPDPSGPSAAEWAKTDFFSTAIHELKAPLTTISAQIQRARKLTTSDPERGRAAMELALDQVGRMDRLIVGLQDAIRLRSNAMSLEVVTFNLTDAVAQAIIRHEHEETTRFRFDRPEVGVPVSGDSGRVAQILDNLISNAIKYSALGAPIDIALTTKGDEAQVRVEDHGLGVPSDERDRLFAPYFRTQRTRDIPGSGLGLHISRRLAEQHRGRLWLESSGDVGSTFVLALPLAG